MSDECKHCTLRGDYTACINEPCSKHDSWIDQERKERIAELEAESETQGNNFSHYADKVLKYEAALITILNTSMIGDPDIYTIANSALEGTGEAEE